LTFTVTTEESVNVPMPMKLVSKLCQTWIGTDGSQSGLVAV
jgi:hypothetical protein